MEPASILLSRPRLLSSASLLPFSPSVTPLSRRRHAVAHKQANMTTSQQNLKSHLTSQTRVGASGRWFPPRLTTVLRSRPPSPQRSSQCVKTAHAGCSHHLSLSHTEEHICILLSLRVPREGSRFEMQMQEIVPATDVGLFPQQQNLGSFSATLHRFLFDWVLSRSDLRGLVEAG